MGPNPTGAVQQTSDPLRRLDEQYNACGMLLARELLDEGVVKVHLHTKDGTLCTPSHWATPPPGDGV